MKELRYSRIMSVITRFAPSPTGMLHIGGARTALFNYMFARKHSGKFFLRIEDTDVLRSSDVAKTAILSGLKWLGIDYDGDAVYQMSRQERHVAIARQMVELGHAYYAYDTEDELASQRVECEKAGVRYKYSGKWRDTLENPPNINPVIRLKVPEGKIILHDLIHGDLVFDNDTIDDMIILRSDGTPTYMLAVVVDDIDMNITHVIRGDDHISNTPKQILIYNAIGARIPEFAHIPLTHDISGKKLSKRHGAVAVEEYRDLGYLPDALCNYLMQLGWSARSDHEIMSLSEAISIFDIDQIGKSPSRFDMEKLDHINLHYIKKTDNERLLELMVNIIRINYSVAVSDHESERMLSAMEELKKNATLVKMACLGLLYLDSFEQYVSQDAIDLIEKSGDVVDKLSCFVRKLDCSKFKQSFDDLLKENGWKFSKVGPVLRSMLIGRSESMSLSVIVQSLGESEVVRRFELMLKYHAKS